MSHKWAYRVYQQMRDNPQDKWRSYPTIATFETIQTADHYARAFARRQGERGKRNTLVVVASRRGKRVVAAYRSDDFVVES